MIIERAVAQIDFMLRQAQGDISGVWGHPYVPLNKGYQEKEDTMSKGKRHRWYLSLNIAVVILIMAAGVVYVEAQSSPNYSIEIDVFSGGGGDSLSTNYDLFSLMGQPSAIGTSSSNHYVNYAGFLGTLAYIPPLEVRISGGAYFYPETFTYRASFSMEIIGPSSPSGWLKYYYTRTRMNFVSTGITSVSAVGDNASISGSGTVNGVSGYTFTATIADVSPDSFGIVIRRSDGSIYYSVAPKNISGGNLVID